MLLDHLDTVGLVGASAACGGRAAGARRCFNRGMRDAFSACMAAIVGEHVPQLEPEEGWQRWLAGRALGLIPVADPAGFLWAGPWIARLDAPGDPVLVMFGVPPGVLLDPSGAAGSGPIVEGWVVAPLALALAGVEPFGRPDGAVGHVEAIVLADGAEAPARTVARAWALPGRGLEGDRYASGAGSFSSGPNVGRALTLVEAEALDDLGLIAAVDARRNVVTRGIRLNPLVGRRFMIGEVECVGRRLCEPCALLERLTRPGVLRALVHRGGLRADILSEGEIAVGDAVRVIETAT